MQAILHTYFDQIEAKKTEFVSRVLSYSEQERNLQPKPGEWSPAQIVDHLIYYENWMLAGSQKAIEAGESLKHGMLATIFTGLLRFLIGRNRRVGTLKQFEPAVEVNLIAKLEEWREIRKSTRQRLGEMTSKQMNQAFTVHPFAGPINAASALELISLHLDYHLKYLAKNPDTT